MSRFLLDLQEAHQRTIIGLASDDPLYTSRSLGPNNRSLNFASALGSLGATIDPALGDSEDNEDSADDGTYHESKDLLPANESELEIELKARVSQAANGIAGTSPAQVQEIAVS